MKQLEKRVVAKVPRELLPSLNKILSVFEREFDLTHFLLKSFAYYPVYTQYIKETAHSAKYIGAAHQGLEGAALNAFVYSVTDPVGEDLLRECKECFRMLESKIFYSKFRHVLDCKEFKDVAKYIKEQQPNRWHGALQVVQKVES